MVLETVLVIISERVHSANAATEVVQLKEVFHTFGHVHWLREDGVSESSSNTCVCNVDTASYMYSG